VRPVECSCTTCCKVATHDSVHGQPCCSSLKLVTHALLVVEFGRRSTRHRDQKLQAATRIVTPVCRLPAYWDPKSGRPSGRHLQTPVSDTVRTGHNDSKCTTVLSTAPCRLISLHAALSVHLRLNHLEAVQVVVSAAQQHPAVHKHRA
jgi:hypothetical protein